MLIALRGSRLTGNGREVWDKCLGHIRERITSKSFENWFAETRAEKIENGCLEVVVGSQVACDWLKAHYMPLIEEAVRDSVNVALKVSVTQGELNRSEGSPNKVPIEAEPPIVSAQRETPRESVEVPFAFNKDYTFENFVVGDGNRLAQAAAAAVIEESGRLQFNPLFIFGGPGLGKTHLLHAIGNHLAGFQPTKRVRFTTAEAFMQDFIESLRARSTQEFKEQYRSLEVLLVDDVQFLLRGEHTQNEFFHTFNELHQGGRTIVMTCDRPPEQLVGAEDRLISRFKWGLVTCVEAPDLQSRIAIVKRKAARSGIELQQEVAAFIANYAKGNIRELEGALNALMAYCVVNNCGISVSAAQSVLRRRGDVALGGLNVSAIQLAVSRHFGISVELLVGRTRKQEVVRARHIAMYLSRQLTSESQVTIGSCFGKRDHSTVVHAIQCVEQRLRVESSTKDAIKSISEDLSSLKRDDDGTAADLAAPEGG